MTPFLWDNPLDIDSDAGQAALAKAHRAGDRVLCRCRSPHPKMYIATIGGKFIVKRMPDTGPDHAPDCASFLPPEELSGLAQIKGSAISENPDDGSTTLKLGFPLKKNRKSGTIAQGSQSSNGKPMEAKAPERQMTITSLLHFLWHEADLGRWYPAMEGKRWWGVVQYALRSAVAGKHAKGKNLAQVLYVPENFKLERKAEIAARRNSMFRVLRPTGNGPAPLGLLIAEYKGCKPTRTGGRLFMFKHLPDCPFFADKDLADRFDKVFSERLELAEFVQTGHVIVIASFSVAKAGYPVLQEIGMMLVTENWIPFEYLRELEVVTALTEQKRAFQKSLRFNLGADAPIAAAVLTDTPEPVALFVADDPDNTNMIASMAENASEGRFPAWLWIDEEPMQDFPEPRSQTASVKGDHMR